MSIVLKFSELAFIAPETKRVLERLSHMPDVNVTIISGREMNDLRQKVSDTQKCYESYIYLITFFASIEIKCCYVEITFSQVLPTNLP